LKGALFYALKWELNVVYLSKSDRFKATVKVDSIRLVGGEGEIQIGEPRDFDEYNSVQETLRSSSRRAYDAKEKINDH